MTQQEKMEKLLEYIEQWNQQPLLDELLLRYGPRLEIKEGEFFLRVEDAAKEEYLEVLLGAALYGGPDQSPGRDSSNMMFYTRIRSFVRDRCILSVETTNTALAIAALQYVLPQ